jgi:hypothetical protein
MEFSSQVWHNVLYGALDDVNKGSFPSLTTLEKDAGVVKALIKREQGLNWSRTYDVATNYKALLCLPAETKTAFGELVLTDKQKAKKDLKKAADKLALEEATQKVKAEREKLSKRAAETLKKMNVILSLTHKYSL